MQVSRFSAILFLTLTCASCIVPFDPDIQETQDLMVISGVITDKPGLHYVTVSRSIAFDEPWVSKPVSGCKITIIDELGEERPYKMIEPGRYEVNLDRSFLKVNRAYGIIVKSLVGSIYKSDLDTLLASPPVDALYFEESSKRHDYEGVSYPGIQFYTDLKPLKNGAQSFRWVLNETWEYKVPHSANYIYEDTILYSFPGGDFSTCYKTRKIESLYSASTRNQIEQELRRNPLNFVFSNNHRLSIKYSVLVEQQSLTNTAYNYWSRLRSSINDTISLYETQPLNIVGNIYNESNPQEQVLGLFYASQVSKKRIIIENGFGFGVASPYCPLTDTHLDSLQPFTRHYLIGTEKSDGSFSYKTGDPDCFNCMESGGILEKPDYWE